ncbi:MAG: cob(I)yrinic acid a,c-diamide adenosyltransferase [Candidatus Curtissbacteria bacterium]|nr:cob(I)yrinic acid a,c-diamide adenosyltransferase [Candidatus Curtissbacteria bacterium]
MKIYTKTGDSGTTSLFGGERVDKDSARINATGAVDELNSQLGVILAALSSSLRGVKRQSNLNLRDRHATLAMTRIRKKLLRLQRELFVFGADLATPYDVKVKTLRVGKSYVSRLEAEIDEWQKTLSPLRYFILPGGSEVGARLHLARTIARRAERQVVKLSKQEKINPQAILFINRLSDWLFVLARYANKLDGVSETAWMGRKSK